MEGKDEAQLTGDENLFYTKSRPSFVLKGFCEGEGKKGSLRDTISAIAT